MNAAAPAEQSLVAVPLEQISLGKNYRHRHGSTWQAKLEELARSMREKGQLQAILCRPSPTSDDGGLEVVYGERRYRAAKIAGLETILTTVRDIDDADVLDLQVLENDQREDTHPLDQAEAFAEMVKRGRTPAQIAERIGRDPSYVAKRIALLQLCKEAREALDEEKITLTVALLLARLPDKKLQADALQSVLDDSCDGPMPAAKVGKLIEDQFMLRLESAPFETTDAKLVPKAGACSACPKRTGAQRELFSDVKNPDLCTDQACYDTKVEAVWQIRKKEAQAGGAEVLEGKAATQALHGHGSKYRDLDDTVWVGQKRKTIRELLGKDLPPVTLARTDTGAHHGEIRQLVPKADVDKVLKTKLKSKEDREDVTDDGGFRERQKREERKLKLRRRAIQEALGVAVERVAKVSDEKLIELLVRTLAARVWNEVQASVLDRRNARPKAGNYETALLKLVKDGDVAGVGFELVLRSGAPWNMHTGGFGHSDLWRDGLKLVGVDFGAIEKRVAAEAKAAKGKPKGKAAGPIHLADDSNPKGTACGAGLKAGGTRSVAPTMKGVTCENCVRVGPAVIARNKPAKKATKKKGRKA